MKLDGIAASVAAMLEEIQKSLYERAVAFRDAHTKYVGTYDEFKSAVESGFAYAYWCGNSACEASIKEETKATMRCIPLDQPSSGPGKCVYCGEAAAEQAVFARAY